jgi:hypothetical protein
MKNYFVTISFNTHCNENDITSMRKKVLECVKVKFWNTKNLKLEFNLTKEKDDRNQTRL